MRSSMASAPAVASGSRVALIGHDPDSIAEAQLLGLGDLCSHETHRSLRREGRAKLGPPKDGGGQCGVRVRLPGRRLIVAIRWAGRTTWPKEVQTELLNRDRAPGGGVPAGLARRALNGAQRWLEHALLQSHTPLAKTLPALNPKRLAQFEAATSPHESLRIHIPRALFSVYAVRNKRDAAHLNDGIDANLQDSTYVVGVLDWVLAELVRIYHDVAPAIAQAIIDDLVVREVPVIEEIAGQPVLSKSLGVSDRILVFLYRAGRNVGLPIAELQRQMRHPDRSNLTKAVSNLDKKGLVLLHPGTGHAHITSTGMADVEGRQLLKPG